MTRPLKICYVSPNAHLGGAERIIEILLKHHDRERFEPSVVFLKQGPLVKKWQELGFQTWVTPPFRLRNPLSLKSACNAFGNYAQAQAFDVIHSHLSYGHLISTLSLRKINAKRMWFQHGPVGRGLDSIAGFLPAETVFFNSEFTARQQSISRSIQTRIVYGPVERPRLSGEERLQIRAAQRKALDLRETDIVLLHVARIDPWKGQDLVLEAFSKLRRRSIDAKLVFFGDASIGSRDYFEALKTRAMKPDLHGHVRFAGFESDIEKIYSVGDVFIHSALTPEPLGLTVLEAQMRSLPVIVADAGGLREVVTDQKDGLMYPSGNVDGLVNAISKMLDSADLRRTLASAGLESVSRFEASTWTKLMEDAYRA